MPELKINGSVKSYDSNNFPAFLADLIIELDLDNISIVAEINGTIIRKEDFPHTALQDGMTIELVKFVGGG